MTPRPAGASSAVTLPLWVVVDGVELGRGEVALRTYANEPERLAAARFAAAVRDGLLALADDLADSYGITSDQCEGIMNTPALTHADIDVRFGFHTAAGRPDVGERHDYLRYLCRELGHALVDQLPEGPDKRLAIENLEAVMMRGNRAIAIGFRDASAAPSAPPPVLPPTGATRPVPRPPSAYGASRPKSYRGAEVPASPRPAPVPRQRGDGDAPRTT